MAGLTFSFIIFPVGNLVAKLAFKTQTNALRLAFNSLYKIMKDTGGKIGAKEVLEKFGKSLSRKVGAILRNNKWLLKSVLGVTKIVKAHYYGIKSFIKYCKESGWGLQYLIPVLRFIKNYIFKPLWGIMKLMSTVLFEMSLYDPDFTGTLLDMVGFNRLADWLHAQPKLLLSVHNWWLEKVNGNLRAAMTTTPESCTRSVYTWDSIVDEFTGEFEPEGEPTEEEIWEEWVKGWRPAAAGGMNAMLYNVMVESTPGIKQEFPEIMTDCYKWVKLSESEDEDDLAKGGEIMIWWNENK